MLSYDIGCVLENLFYNARLWEKLPGLFQITTFFKLFSILLKFSRFYSADISQYSRNLYLD